MLGGTMIGWVVHQRIRSLVIGGGSRNGFEPAEMVQF